jgi:hypothetical protein
MPRSAYLTTTPARIDRHYEQQFQQLIIEQTDQSLRVHRFAHGREAADVTEQYGNLNGLAAKSHFAAKQMGDD